ncbi:MAG: bifunctional phosphopantothenoylcysteine decarboxylase/phosphopantothenate--cysteine ligase CoaBC [Acidimicrobiales bacterium]
MRLTGRRIVLGVCGGIAAYKAVEVCRRLVDGGAHVIPVMTEDATRFVGEVTLSALASEKVQTSLWREDDPVPHVALGRSADAIVVAPATARLLGSYAGGISDDLLSATLLATRAPVLLCPAMHTEMWEHAAVRHNVAVLRERGVHVLDPGSGPLARGDDGPGRLPEPATVVDAVAALFAPHDLHGRRVVVAAGGTREPIDAVRFIANRSSGKQGHALADEAASRGASVTLVTAARLRAATGVEVVTVDTAAEMEAAVLSRSDRADVVIMAAAVADFRPKAPAGHKLAKTDGPPEVILEPTTDIVTELVRRRRPGQVLVGFAAETGDAVGKAEAKLAAKGLDVIVANDVAAPGVGFDSDRNEVTVLSRDGSRVDLALSTKRVVARQILDVVAARLDSLE